VPLNGAQDGFAILALPLPAEDLRLGSVAIGNFVALISCYVLVGMWIYRTNKNAHVFSDGSVPGSMSLHPDSSSPSCLRYALPGRSSPLRLEPRRPFCSDGNRKDPL
jgi:hypothetical protein